MTIDDIEALISKHGSITAQPLKDLVVTVVLEAIEAEREACAFIIEDMDVQHPKYIADAIRKRGDA